jgi:hypothetical protein
MEELSLEDAGSVRHRTVTWTDPLVGAALARDLSGTLYAHATTTCLVFEPRGANSQGH